MTKLNVGCGRDIKEGWINLDRVAGKGVDVVHDLNTREDIPLPDDTFDKIYMRHILEHITEPLFLMEQLHRVSKNAAICEIRLPYGGSSDAWEDQTHVRPYFESSFIYFAQPTYWAADYGYRGDWRIERIALLVDKDKITDNVAQIIKTQRNIVTEMVAILSAVKPIRPQERDLRQEYSAEIHAITPP